MLPAPVAAMGPADTISQVPRSAPTLGGPHGAETSRRRQRSRAAQFEPMLLPSADETLVSPKVRKPMVSITVVEGPPFGPFWV